MIKRFRDLFSQLLGYDRTPKADCQHRGWSFTRLALLAATLPTYLWTPLNMDSAWYLYAAGSVLEGAKLYQDIIDVNPPLIVYLSLPPVWIAQLFDFSAVAVFKVLMFFLLFMSLAASVQLTYKILDKHHQFQRNVIVLSLIFVLFPFSFTSFGQRAHILLALVIPYVFLSILRVMGQRISPGWACLAGLTAGVGMNLKPHFLILWVALECYLVMFRKLPIGRMRPESLTSAGSILLYSGYMVAVSDYPAVASLALRVYGAYNSDLVSLLLYPGNLIYVTATILFLLLRSTSEYQETRSIFFVACMSFYLSGLLQQKAWRYHFYPGEAFGVLLIVMCMLSLSKIPALKLFRKYDRILKALVVSGIVCCSLVLLGYVVGPKRLNESKTIDAWVRLIHSHSQGQPIVFLSTSVYPAFPVVNYSGARWSSRFNCLWFLPGLYLDQQSMPGGLFPYRSLSSMSSLERELLDEVVSDLLSKPPELIIIRSSPVMRGFGRTSFDMLEYFSAEPRFQKLFSTYEEVGQMDSHRIFRRM